MYTTLQQDPKAPPDAEIHERCTATKTRSWRAPATIMVSLVLGVGLALAHHLMCDSLSGRPVNEVSISQPWISRFSTAFAFLVKTTLAIAVGTAYTQRQWLSFQRDSFRTADVDALTSVLGNIFSFFSTFVWLRYPLLSLTALVSW